MNFMQLKYFNAVCELGSVSEAAKHLHVAQPSVSVAIRELEEEFGTVLFNRHHRGMRLTAEGTAFLTMSRDILERVALAEKSMKEMGKNKKTLRLGVPPMIGSLILPIIYGEFVANNTDVHLEITECGREETCKRLDAGELDLAFISHDRITDPTLTSINVGRLEIVCCVSEESPLSREVCITPRTLSQVPLVMFKDGFFQSLEIQGWFSGAGIEPQILIKTDQLSTMLKIISTNTAVGFTFDGLMQESGMKAIPTDPPLAVNVSLIRKKDGVLFNSMKRFIEFLNRRNLFS